MTGITVIVPTLGRSTLTNTLGSLATQLGGDDVVLVISDGRNEQVRHLVTSYEKAFPAVEWTYLYDRCGCYGHNLRNVCLDRYVKTSHVWTVDDDDQAQPGAVEALRAHMDDPWTVFRMVYGPAHFANGLTCWRSERLSLGDIGTPMMFAPISSARFGLSYAGDYAYALSLQELLGDPVWATDVVALIKPVADGLAS